MEKIDCAICLSNQYKHMIYRKSCDCSYDICLSCVQSMIENHIQANKKPLYLTKSKYLKQDLTLDYEQFAKLICSDIKCLYCKKPTFVIDNCGIFNTPIIDEFINDLKTNNISISGSNLTLHEYINQNINSNLHIYVTNYNDLNMNPDPHIYAINYNILRILSGTGGLSYSS